MAMRYFSYTVTLEYFQGGGLTGLEKKSCFPEKFWLNKR